MNRFVLLLLISLKINAQDTIVYPKVDLFKRNILEISYGMPLGQLEDKYQNSINTAMYFRTKIAKKQFIDFGLELGALNKPRKVSYSVASAPLIVDPGKTTFLLGFRYSRFLFLSKDDNIWIESNTGLGWKYIHYKIPDKEEFKALDFEPSLNTIAISQGVKIMFYGFGIHANYQYAPYDLFNKNAENNFGGSSLNFGVSGSWNF